MNKQDLQKRTKAFAPRVIQLVDVLPKRRSADVIGGQLLRSATSVAANYRAACRARSQAEFIAKLGIVEEEADESEGWMDLLADANLIPRSKVAALISEASKLTAITVASIKTARNNLKRPKP